MGLAGTLDYEAAGVVALVIGFPIYLVAS